MSRSRSPNNTVTHNALKCVGCGLVVLSLFFLSVTSAWSHQCRFYKPDKRNLCLAQEEGARFYCNYIKDPDQKNYCFAYLDRAPSRCDSITDEALKAQCGTEAQARLDEAEAKRKAEEAKRKEEEAKRAQEATQASQNKGKPGGN